MAASQNRCLISAQATRQKAESSAASGAVRGAETDEIEREPAKAMVYDFAPAVKPADGRNDAFE